ncbi:MAG: pyridoxal-phosphate dependent enzyme [candidate division NC10 bacterium]|nr:pyridoxal-phosphate dependent enzyme [candidate division NC10 bacterium]
MADLTCAACGRVAAFGDGHWRCACGGPFESREDRPFPRAALERRPPGLWRYWEAFPLPGPDAAVSLGEGMTPLLPLGWDGTPVLCKLEFLMPTGSFKDRGATVLLSLARRLGVRRVVEDSSGNAAAAVAAYAAAAGLTCELFVPAGASLDKLTQARAYGAVVRAVPGGREAAAAAAQEAARSAFYASHVWHPAFFAGTRTFAYEVWEQLGGEAPDAVVLPAGHGTLLLGCWWGFGDLVRWGYLTRAPRLIAVQAARCAPLAAGWAGREPEPPAQTMAEGIAIAAPVRLPQMLRAVRETRGAVLAVPEEAIAAAWRRAAAAGLYVEPTAAVPLAGLSAAVAAGLCRAGERIVVPLTGSGLKAAGAAARLLP